MLQNRNLLADIGFDKGEEESRQACCVIGAREPCFVILAIATFGKCCQICHHLPILSLKAQVAGLQQALICFFAEVTQRAAPQKTSWHLCGCKTYHSQQRTATDQSIEAHGCDRMLSGSPPDHKLYPQGGVHRWLTSLMKDEI